MKAGLKEMVPIFCPTAEATRFFDAHWATKVAAGTLTVCVLVLVEVISCRVVMSVLAWPVTVASSVTLAGMMVRVVEAGTITVVKTVLAWLWPWRRCGQW